MKTVTLYLFAINLVSCSAIVGANNDKHAEFTVLHDTLSRSVVRTLYSGVDPEYLNIDSNSATSLVNSLPKRIIEYAETIDTKGRKKVLVVQKNFRHGLYNIQLVGYRLNGRKLVFINGLSKNLDLPEWREKYKFVNDGGTDFWFGIFDIEKQMFIILQVNGEA